MVYFIKFSGGYDRVKEKGKGDSKDCRIKWVTGFHCETLLPLWRGGR